VTLLSVSVHPSSLWLPLGWGKYLAVTGTFSNATTADVTRDCMWSSSDYAVVDVYNGYVNGVTQGQAVITAECGGASGNVSVSVGLAETTTLALAYESWSSEGHLLVLSDPTVEPWQTLVLRVLANSTDGAVRDVTNLASWSSSDPSVAWVDTWGIVHAVKLGKTEITATVQGKVAKRGIVVVPPPLYVFITSPEDNSTGDRKEITVRGTVISKAQEVGVRVNGVPATVSGNEFVANRVPVGEGTSVIKAEAIDTNGATAVAAVTVTVNITTSGNPLRLAASIESGIGPLETVLRIDGVAGTAPDISYAGPGNVEFLDCSSPDSCKIRMTTEGVYVFTVTIVGYDGKTYSDSIAITVLDRAKLDALLKAKWEGMKNALKSEDITGALNYILPASRQKYSNSFTALQANISEIANSMQNIELVYVSDTVARYRIRRYHMVFGQYRTITYYIYIRKDQNGQWLIDEF